MSRSESPGHPSNSFKVSKVSTYAMYITFCNMFLLAPHIYMENTCPLDRIY